MATAALATAMLLAAPGAFAQVGEEQLPGDLLEQTLESVADALGHVPRNTETRCDTLTTICATSIAVSSPVCTKVGFQTVQCTGAATVGGHGVSPILKLPGRVDWSGSGSASDACSASKSASGSASWPGLLGPSGSGSEQTLELCTKVSFCLFGCTIRMSVRSDADATARTQVGGVTVSSVNAPHAGETVSGSAST